MRYQIDVALVIHLDVLVREVQGVRMLIAVCQLPGSKQMSKGNIFGIRTWKDKEEWGVSLEERPNREHDQLPFAKFYVE